VEHVRGRLEQIQIAVDKAAPARPADPPTPYDIGPI
jgi:hypothetical protein